MKTVGRAAQTKVTRGVIELVKGFNENFGATTFEPLSPRCVKTPYFQMSFDTWHKTYVFSLVAHQRHCLLLSELQKRMCPGIEIEPSVYEDEGVVVQRIALIREEDFSVFLEAINEQKIDCILAYDY